MWRSEEGPGAGREPGRRKGLRLAAALAAALVFAGGCAPDMEQDGRLKPLQATEFFSDTRSSRELVPGTVPRGWLREGKYLFTGVNGDKPGEELPPSLKVTRAFLTRGQQRFAIFCAPCHGLDGSGDSVVVRRGMKRPPSFHTDGLRSAAIGHFFDVITNGTGRMNDYATQIPPEDRWAIAAYIRVLQLSQHATLEDATSAGHAELEARR